MRDMIGNLQKPVASAMLVSVALSVSATALHAGDGASPMPDLPGVDGKASDQTGIRPQGEPLLEAPLTDENGFVRMGDWDVKISGNVTIDIGTFAPRTGR
jgi:hypothetical protein